MRRLTLLILVLLAGTLQAADIRSLDVRQQGESYLLDVTAYLDVAPNEVYRILEDWRNYPSLNPRIEEVRRLRRNGDGSLRLHTTLRPCLLFLCTTLIHIQDFHFHPEEAVLAINVPNRGSFRSGTTRWLISPEGDGSLLTFHSELVPNFRVPPIFGNWVIRRGLRRESIHTIEAVEQQASHNALLTSIGE